MSGHHHDHGHDDPHDNDHGHVIDGRDHRPGLRGAIASIVRPHSHDAADSLDSALEASRRGVRAVRISFVALVLTALLQLGVVLATGSVGLLADTIHNFADALTAIPLFVAFRLSRRAANRRYTYGYRRAEDLAGLFVILMIAASGLIAAVEAVRRLVHPEPVTHLGVLFAAALVGFVGNELVAVYRIREGEAIGSAALMADGVHARTDGFTSLAVAVGAVGLWAGLERADAIVGIAISVAIFAVLRRAAVGVYYRLMDAVDPAVVDRVETTASSAPGVVAIADARVRWLGHRLVADLDVVVPGGLSVRDGHAIAEEVRHRLLHEVRHLDDAHVHVDPDDADSHGLLSHHPRA
jgi:cation diffusion facilitator family transporter